MTILQWIAIAILAITPVMGWMYFLLQRTTEKKPLLARAFILGAISTIPLLIYRWTWLVFPELDVFNSIAKLLSDSSISFGMVTSLPLYILFTFLLVGFTEELLKSFVLRYIVPQKELETPGDAVDFAIVIALGFAFVENISYFAQAYQAFNSTELIKIFISRAIFATFAHVVFSSIFAIYYGRAVHPKRSMRNRKSWQVKSVKYLKQLFPKLGKVELFQREELFIGLTYAAVAHAFYNIFLELHFTPFLIPFLFLGLVEVYRLRDTES